jgi:hypothetical protein
MRNLNRHHAFFTTPATIPGYPYPVPLLIEMMEAFFNHHFCNEKGAITHAAWAYVDCFPNDAVFMHEDRVTFGDRYDENPETYPSPREIVIHHFSQSHDADKAHELSSLFFESLEEQLSRYAVTFQKHGVLQKAELVTGLDAALALIKRKSAQEGEGQYVKLTRNYRMHALCDLWNRLDLVVFDSEGRSLEPFLHFMTGTLKADIEQWFERQHPEFKVSEVDKHIPEGHAYRKIQ